jgi:hypothetical protein
MGILTEHLGASTAILWFAGVLLVVLAAVAALGRSGVSSQEAPLPRGAQGRSPEPGPGDLARRSAGPGVVPWSSASPERGNEQDARRAGADHQHARERE